MKKLFLNISQYSQENTCVGAFKPVTLLKRNSTTRRKSFLKKICERLPLKAIKIPVCSSLQLTGKMRTIEISKYSMENASEKMFF